MVTFPLELDMKPYMTDQLRGRVVQHSDAHETGTDGSR